MSKQAKLVTLSVVVLVSSFLSGCGYVWQYRQMQIANDTQDLVRQYKTCLEENRGNPEAVEKLCKPYLDAVRAVRGSTVVIGNGR